MNDNATSGQESDGRTDIEITVCANGVVNVHRPESERAHSVILDVRGDVAHCSCKGHKFRGECAHADAIESRPLVASSALAAAASHHDPQDSAAAADADAARAVADGGHVESTDSELPAIVDCDDDPHRSRCTGCGATGPKGLGDDDPAILHDRDCPRDDSGDETDGSDRDTRGVVDPYADRVEERKNVDETPL